MSQLSPMPHSPYQQTTPARWASCSRLRFSAAAILFFAALVPVAVADVGDVNADNAVDLADALLLCRFLEGTIPSLPDPQAADIDGDGTVDETDRTLLLGINIGGTLPIDINIDTPLANTVTALDGVTVSGTLHGASTVTVNGTAAVVAGGTFVATGVQLVEGTNTLVATGQNTLGHTGSDTIVVRRDTSPPLVIIESPLQGDRLIDPTISIAGTVNDIIPGATVNADDVDVTINGLPAEVNNRSFFLTSLPLALGSNVIEASAVDIAGNVGTTLIEVTREPDLAGIRLVVAGGNAQSAPISSLLTDPLEVRVENVNGDPIVGRPVTFTVSNGDGLLNDPLDNIRSLSLLSDALGEVQVDFTIGSRTGMGFHRVRATTPGSLSKVEFCATAEVSAPENIAINGIPHLRGVVNETLAMPLSTIVTDAGGNPVPDVDITFDVVLGNGNLGGQQTAVIPTNADGISEILWTLGPDTGAEVNEVSATFAGNPGFPATFTATGISPGAVADTTVSGVVQDSTGNPIVSALAVVRGTSLQATTGADGKFVIGAVPPGGHHVAVLGSVANDPPNDIFFPDIEFALEVISGVDNSLDPPVVVLPFLNNAGTQLAGGATDVVLTMADVPGFAIKVFAHSTHVRDPNTGQLVQQPVNMSSSQVKFDKVPMPPPQGSTPLVVGTLQPGGIILDPPAEVTYPNVEGYAPGDVADVFAFHHDIGQFVNIGPGTVSEDGTVVVSDPGFGIVQSGWHCLIRLPGPAANCENCDCDDGNSCTEDFCEDGTCFNAPIICADGNFCTTDFCINGGCASEPIDCDDGSVCTDDSCNPSSGCEYTPVDGPCDDGDECTLNDMCSGGSCDGEPIDCDDANACTDDVCIGGSCFNDPRDCDDGNECTEDTCDPATGCVH